MYKEALRESEKESRYMQSLQELESASAVFSDEEVFVSQLYRRAVLLNEEFQEAVFNVLKRYQISSDIREGSLRKDTVHGDCEFNCDLANDAHMPEQRDQGSSLASTRRMIPPSDCENDSPTSRSADTKINRLDLSRMEHSQICDPSHTSQVIPGFFEITRARSADHVFSTALIGFSRSRSADIAPCPVTLHNGLQHVNATGHMSQSHTRHLNASSSQKFTAEAQLVYAKGDASNPSFEKKRRELLCMFEEGPLVVEFTPGSVKTVTRMREKVLVLDIHTLQKQKIRFLV